MRKGNNTVAYSVKFWHAAEKNRRKQHPTTVSKQKQNSTTWVLSVSVDHAVCEALSQHWRHGKKVHLHIAHCMPWPVLTVGRMHQRERLCFSVPDNCLLGHMQAMPSSQVGPVVSCQRAQQASALLPGHVWLDADRRTPLLSLTRDATSIIVIFVATKMFLSRQKCVLFIATEMCLSRQTL